MKLRAFCTLLITLVAVIGFACSESDPTATATHTPGTGGSGALVGDRAGIAVGEDPFTITVDRYQGLTERNTITLFYYNLAELGQECIATPQACAGKLPVESVRVVANLAKSIEFHIGTPELQPHTISTSECSIPTPTCFRTIISYLTTTLIGLENETHVKQVGDLVIITEETTTFTKFR